MARPLKQHVPCLINAAMHSRPGSGEMRRYVPLNIAELDVAIAGAGIAGLSAAIALASRVRKVTVYEVASELKQIGAGIQLSPNATRHLIRWGVDKYLPELRNSVSSINVRRWKTGSIIGRWATETYHQRYGSPYTSVFRADLQTALLKVAREMGVQILVGTGVSEFDPEQHTMTLESGQKVCPDLMINAEGARSTPRHNQLDNTSNGRAIIRATVESERLYQDPVFDDLLQGSAINLWIGPGQHVVAYRMKNETLMNLVFEFAEQSDPGTWSGLHYTNQLRTQFEGWDPILGRLLDIAGPLSKWPLWVSPPPEDSQSQFGGMACIGDASYTVLPHLAQGAAMAIEDAHVLASLLGEADPSDDLDKLLSKFQQIRLERRAQVQKLSIHNVKLYHLNDGTEQERRDDPDSSDQNLRPIWHSSEDQDWLYGYKGV